MIAKLKTRVSTVQFQPLKFYLFKFIHNALVHPLMAWPWEPQWVTRLHDCTARRWEQVLENMYCKCCGMECTYRFASHRSPRECPNGCWGVPTGGNPCQATHKYTKERTQVEPKRNYKGGQPEGICSVCRSTNFRFNSQCGVCGRYFGIGATLIEDEGNPPMKIG